MRLIYFPWNQENVWSISPETRKMFGLFYLETRIMFDSFHLETRKMFELFHLETRKMFDLFHLETRKIFIFLLYACIRRRCCVKNSFPRTGGPGLLKPEYKHFKQQILTTNFKKIFSFFYQEILLSNILHTTSIWISEEIIFFCSLKSIFGRKKFPNLKNTSAKTSDLLSFFF